MNFKHLFSLSLIALTPSLIMAVDFTVSVPEGAQLTLGTKSTHYVDFNHVEATSQITADGITTYTFDLTVNKVYNYRTWKDEGLTHAGYFTMNADPAKCPTLNFVADDYNKHNPKDVNHSPQDNGGYETGNIFVNINPQGYLKLSVGQSFNVHAMRTWELTDNSVNNYFIEPDFHYTVLDINGKTSSNVITIEETQGSAWAKINAIAKGTAIVLVTYDGINLNYYSGVNKNEYLGGEYWGAIWPENTGVFVVSVDETESIANPNMKINVGYNDAKNKLAGDYIDAEHDIFYYLNTDDGYYYTFTPENVANVEIAYPTIGQQSISFSGFSSDGITQAGDGSYTILLKQGRQIVKMTDSNGNCTYQVLTAKICNRSISNASREGSSVYQPGDKIKVQYSGLFHPANKLAGIYNMSAYVTYNNTPNGSSLIQSANQYTFGSSEAAQTIIIQIPENYDLTETYEFKLNDGVIQVNGYGDPIGNHRNTDPSIGRSPNLNAVAHKTYFGAIPEISVNLQPIHYFNISITSNVTDTDITVIYEGNKIISPNDDGTYKGSYGAYDIIAKHDGYRCYRSTFKLGEDDQTDQSFEIEMIEGSNDMWDGNTITEVTPDDEGTYHITTGAQLAYISQYINENSNKVKPKVVLENDIDLGDFDWTPIGNASKTYFAGQFDGQGHVVKGLYIHNSTLDYAGLFGCVQGLSTSHASICNVTVSGHITGKQYVAGVAAKVDKYASVDCCANLADVSGSSHVGGIVGYLSASTICSLSNSYNIGNITAVSSVGGVIGYNNKSASISNIYNIGNITGDATNSTGACVGGSTTKDNVTNAYSTKRYELNDNSTFVSDDQMATGEIAFALGSAFTQIIGLEPYPVFNSTPVFFDKDLDTYYNVTEIKLNSNEITIHPVENSTAEISATYAPTNAIEPFVTWTSSDDSVVTIEHDNSMHATLHAHQNGVAEIKVELIANPLIYDTCQVCVTTATGIESIFNNKDTVIDVYDISGKVILSKTSAHELNRHLSPGFYILRYSNSETKVFIK